ncbi:hypothetical protein LRS13_15935 [Svornostia abyssi]|uniref:Uncharacterized protein n=1 Tax=Svornostia abyssi TaxID=2898438 RepID=A0ABY5PC03_9ACTN|nr:hypothetical protein LRS13_15935 [Parviterribacteraceae bacterium J379]
MRPLRASIADWLSQPTADGGSGLGATQTGWVLLGLIVLLVGCPSVTKRDVNPLTAEAAAP